MAKEYKTTLSHGCDLLSLANKMVFVASVERCQRLPTSYFFSTGQNILSAPDLISMHTVVAER